jgi:hypothetical protein
MDEVTWPPRGACLSTFPWVANQFSVLGLIASLRSCRFRTPSPQATTNEAVGCVSSNEGVSGTLLSDSTRFPYGPPRIVRNIGVLPRSQIKHAQKLMGKANFTSAEGCVCASQWSQESQHTKQEVRSVFISNASLPHPDGWVWIYNLHYWLIWKGGTWGKGDLKAGRTRNSSGQYSSFSKQFEIRTWQRRALWP